MEVNMRVRDITQAVIAALVTIGLFLLLFAGYEVPEGVWTAWALILGFLFGGATTANGRDGLTTAIRALTKKE